MQRRMSFPITAKERVCVIPNRCSELRYPLFQSSSPRMGRCFSRDGTMAHTAFSRAVDWGVYTPDNDFKYAYDLFGIDLLNESTLHMWDWRYDPEADGSILHRQRERHTRRLRCSRQTDTTCRYALPTLQSLHTEQGEYTCQTPNRSIV